MGDDRKAEGFSLRRWSDRKLAARRDERAPGSAIEPVASAAPADAQHAAGAPALDAAPPPPAHARSLVAPPRADADALPPRLPAGEATPSLPPVESLTFDSDFTAFMQPGVDENVRRSALRKLLRDPRFNVMDGLDVYIDDYSKPSPIEPEVVRTLWQARYLFNPPKTRVTADGVVEDVPEHEAGVEAETPEAAALPTPENVVGAGMEMRPPNDASGARRETAVSQDDDARAGQRGDPEP